MKTKLDSYSWVIIIALVLSLLMIGVSIVRENDMAWVIDHTPLTVLKLFR